MCGRVPRGMGEGKTLTHVLENAPFANESVCQYIAQMAK